MVYMYSKEEGESWLYVSNKYYAIHLCVVTLLEDHGMHVYTHKNKNPGFWQLQGVKCDKTNPCINTMQMLWIEIRLKYSNNHLMMSHIIKCEMKELATLCCYASDCELVIPIEISKIDNSTVPLHKPV